LSGGDGFDDEFVGLSGVDGVGGEFEGLGDEVLDGGVVDHGWAFELDVPAPVAVSFEVAAGIVEAGAVDQEEEADPAGKESDGEDGFGGAFGGAESDGEGVVVVVDEFEGAGEASAHFAKGDAGLGCYFRGEFVEEAVELGGRGFFPCSSRCRLPIHGSSRRSRHAGKENGSRLGRAEEKGRVMAARG
jgi:hypothetical protein